jgi:hypothetical protein
MYDDVGRVEVDLVVRSDELSPDEIGRMLDIPAGYAHSKGDKIVSPMGNVVGTRLYNFWSFGSAMLTTSKDLNDHLQALFPILLPHVAVLHELAKLNGVFLSAVWESSRLDWGSGPIISPASCRGLASLGIELHFDIHCSLEHEEAPRTNGL